MPLTVSMHRQSDTAIVDVAGEIDIASVGELDHQISAAVGTGDTVSAVVDLSGVTFMDSSGINALLKGKRLADSLGKPFRVISADGEVRHLLDLTGVWTHLSGDAT